MSTQIQRVAATFFASILTGLLAGITPSLANDDPLVARVNGYPIHDSYVYKQIEALPLGEQVALRQRIDGFAESLVREEVLFQSVLASGFEDEAELREAIKSTVVQHLIERHVTRHIQVTDADVEAFYEANQFAIKGEGVRASHILLKDTAQCDAMAKVVDSDAKFREAAEQYSLHKISAVKGGDLGMFMFHAGPLGFETALFSMQLGEVKVFNSDEGCHVVRVTERESPPLPPLANVAPRIRALLQAQQERTLLKALYDKAQTRVTVERPE